MSESDKRKVRSLPRCTTCHLCKKPIGRSAPLELANGLCDHECPGYLEDPQPGYLWPGEHETDETAEWR